MGSRAWGANGCSGSGPLAPGRAGGSGRERRGLEEIVFLLQQSHAALPTRREMGACLRRLGVPLEGGNTEAPTTLTQILTGEDDLDMGRGSGKPDSPPPAEERGDVVPRSNQAPRNGTLRGKWEPFGGVGRILIASGGTQKLSPGVGPESDFPLGKEGGPLRGSGGTDPSGRPGPRSRLPETLRGRGVGVMPLCATIRVGAAT